MRFESCLITALCMALFGAVASAQDGGVVNLGTVIPRLRKTFDTELTGIEASRKEKIKQLQEKYLVSLDRLEDAMQGAGRLEVIMAVRKERDRYGADRSLPTSDVGGDAPELAAMCRNFVAAVRTEELSSSQKVVTLVRQYDRSLAALQERYTREGKYDLALAVKAEREAAGAQPEIMAAEFTIADAEAEREAEKAAAARAEETAVTEPESPAAAFEGSAEDYITGRYKVFRDAITGEDWTTAIGIVNPQVVRKRGEESVKLQMQFVLPILKVAKAFGTVIQPGTVSLYEDDTRARLETRVWVDGRWKAGKPTFWTQVDDDWFIELKAPSAAGQGDDDDDNDDDERGARDGRRGSGERRGPPSGRRGPPWRTRRD
jgi:hypothetical protein